MKIMPEPGLLVIRIPALYMCTFTPLLPVQLLNMGQTFLIHFNRHFHACKGELHLPALPEQLLIKLWGPALVLHTRYLFNHVQALPRPCTRHFVHMTVTPK
jgi:hypothetical protein